jgi:alkanesulfonate monooxygenase SsuD/methylene tetrahydromethanopterin reductase-like flavin-dependent oxidoreductase (luciferase family)
MVGSGSGYLEEEYQALGLDVHKRGEMTHEYLACMKELWANPIASFHGKYTNFDEMTISIRPVQQPHPPIVYGSHGPIPRQRIAESYQGSIGNPGPTAESQAAFESDMKDLNRRWKENGRAGKPFLMSFVRAHLTTDESEAGGAVRRGIVPEGQERAYVSEYGIQHVTQMVEELRREDAMGIDLAIVWVPSYNYRNMNNLDLQLQQMDLLGEHVLPKVNRDKDPIEMDFGGKLLRPFAVA